MSENNAKKEFRSFLETFTQIDNQAWQDFEAVLHFKKYKENETVLSAGSTCNFVGFLYKGSTRVFEIIEGKEINRVFFPEKDFVTEYYSFVMQCPSKESIVCLEDSEILLIYYQDLHRLYDKHRSIERMGRRVAEQIYTRLRIKLSKLLILTPEERYLRMKKDMPQLLDAIPHYHIASYLGITPQSLSRIRKRVEGR